MKKRILAILGCLLAVLAPMALTACESKQDTPTIQTGHGPINRADVIIDGINCVLISTNNDIDAECDWTHPTDAPDRNELKVEPTQFLARGHTCYYFKIGARVDGSSLALTCNNATIAGAPTMTPATVPGADVYTFEIGNHFCVAVINAENRMASYCENLA